MDDIGIAVNEKVGTGESLGGDDFVIRFNAVALVRIVEGKTPQIVYHRFVKPDKSMAVARKGDRLPLPEKLEVV